MTDPKQCNIGSKYVSEREMLRREWIHVDRIVEFVSKEAADVVTNGVKRLYGCGWMPCEFHKWYPVAENYYRCSECRAVGFKKTTRSAVTMYKCPVCRNETAEPGESCPNCAPDPGLIVCDRIPKKLNWEHLTPRQQQALRYLFMKKGPTTISNTQGGGSTLRFLSLRGVVRQAGDKNGQTLWELTEEALKRYDVELRKI